MKDGKTWVSAFNYNEFEKELIRKAARALKIAHNSPAHRAMNAEIKGICKHQGITTRTIVVYTVDEFIAILIHIKSCDYALTGKKRKGDELVNPRVNEYENVPV